MLGVIFHFDHKQGLHTTGKRNLFQLLDYTQRAFCPDRVTMVDRDGTYDDADILEHIEYQRTFREALATYEGYTPVYISKRGRETLGSFVHPDNAVYVFGPDYGSQRLPEEGLTVKIDYPNDGMVLWAVVAMGIVLYDRGINGG